MKAYTQIPPGTQIVIGRAARRRRVLEREICSVFEGWSYEEIIPPIFDYYDVFAKGMGTGPEEQIYRFIDREGNILHCVPSSPRSLRRLSRQGSPLHRNPSGCITPVRFCDLKNQKADGS